MKRRVATVAAFQAVGFWALGGLASVGAQTAEVLEVELRWVTHSGVQPGSLSTGSTRAQLDYLGPALRVQAGERAAWRLLEPQEGWQFAWTTQEQGGRLRLESPTGAPRFWELGLVTTRRSAREPLSLSLEWTQPEGQGGSQSWRSRLPVQPDHWTVVARAGRWASQPADGTLRTGEAPVVRELQVRVRSVPQ
ncbi:hypothetical protein [Inhella gelatinilytica]|uniref:Uncharacterized protein n=1 Tax=Inhella gelatinilytica TaxID=2795030 RepID=A0A931NDY1_9BURK|nr:hypothetical protein [Inhella gelatinilytica]MBH9553577.1 hypothetical protein [Inhella gelatinilytica]